MSFSKEDRDKVMNQLTRIETSLEQLIPQVKSNTRFRWMTLGIVGFLITIKDYMKDWIFK